MERCPSDCRASDYHVSDGREADQGGDGQGRGAAPAAPTLGKVVCGHPLPITDLLGYIIIFESLTPNFQQWASTGEPLFFTANRYPNAQGQALNRYPNAQGQALIAQEVVRHLTAAAQ